MDNVLPYIFIALALSFIFFALSVLKSAINSISEVAARKVAEIKGQNYPFFTEKLYSNPSKMRIVLQLSRQTSLIGATFATLAVLNILEISYAVTWTLLASIVVLIMFVEQLAARLVVAINPEKAFAVTIPFLPPVYLIFYPLMIPIYRILFAARKRFGAVIDREDDETLEENIRAFIDVGEKEGILEKEEGILVKSIVDFGYTLAREVMTPRTDMVVIKSDESLESLKKLFIRKKHSRIPVYNDNIDNIAGIVYIKDLLETLALQKGEMGISDFIKPAHFVPETKKVSDLLKEMQHEKIQIAIVVDEYGGTAGLITIEDLVEEIVGEISDVHEREEDDIVKETEDSYLVKGICNIEKVEALFNVELKEEGFDTVGGFIFARLGRVPLEGESFDAREIKFEILRADHRRIRRVRIKKILS
ncbi:MAG: hemolysin family protein [Acidobacteriota bacterium]